MKINSAKGHKKRALGRDPAEEKRMYQSSNYLQQRTDGREDQRKNLNCARLLMVSKEMK